MATTTSPPDGATRSARRAWRLRGRARKLALTAHVLAGVGWFGVALAVAFCAIAAAWTGDPTLSRALYRTISTSRWLSIALGGAAAATGAVLGLGTPFGLVRYWWVVAKIAIAAAVIATDALLVGRVAHAAAAGGHAPAPLFGSTIAHVVVLALATVLSIFKPGGRTPRGRRMFAAPQPRGGRYGWMAAGRPASRESRPPA